jgi:hypothetical protein
MHVVPDRGADPGTDDSAEQRIVTGIRLCRERGDGHGGPEGGNQQRFSLKHV